MRIRCRGCDVETTLSHGASACSQCGHPLLGALATPEPTSAPKLKESKKARLRRALSRPPKQRAASPPAGQPAEGRRLAERLARPADDLAQFPTVMAKLERRDGELVLLFDGVAHPVEVKADVPTDALLHYLLPWAVPRLEASVLRATPKPCRTLTEIRKLHRTGKRPDSNAHFGPRPPGDTQIERAKDPMTQLDRIAKLQQMSTSAALAELANAWRVEGLRRPIEEAMERIGWQRFRHLLDRVPGWPDGLDEVVSRRLAEVAARPKVKRTGAIYNHDEYWLADW